VSVDPSTAIIQWALEHARKEVRQSAEQQMVSEVLITRGNDATLDGNGDLVADPDAAVMYHGKCHLGTASGPVTYTIGDEVQFFSSGTASVPLEWDVLGDGTFVQTDVRVNDLLQVTAHDDFYFVGRLFRIVDVENLGTLAGYRRCQIVGIQRSPGWVDSAVRHPAADIPDEIPPEWQL